MKIRSALHFAGGVALAALTLPAMAQPGTTAVPPPVTTHEAHDVQDSDESPAPSRVVGTPQAIAIGATAQGRLAAGDPRIAEGEAHYKLYAVTVPANTRLSITMKSDAENFDPYLEIGRVENDIFTEIASNDDGGGDGLNSKLVTTLRDAGRYVIRARTFGSDSVGAFTVNVEQLPPPPPPPTPIAITLGQPKQGSLSASDAQIDDDGAHYKYYSFTGTAGQRLAITMESSAFDSYVDLGRLGGDGFEVLASNDDAGGGDEATKFNSRLTVRLKEAGTYIVRAHSLGTDQTGAFTVAVAQLPPAPPTPVPTPLTRGSATRGTLSDASPVLPSESDGLEEGTRYYALYAITGTAGQSLTISAGSPDFDTVLDAGGATPIGFGVVATNDDSEGGARSTDSRLRLHFEKAGTIILRLSALGNGDTGGFTITAE